ncbi:MAG: hypothetical protein L0228_17460 [Planctomycetes bacterium]|nr:hypothetical protein [Planctomycetota bacterium]
MCSNCWTNQTLHLTGRHCELRCELCWLADIGAMIQNCAQELVRPLPFAVGSMWILKVLVPIYNE